MSIVAVFGTKQAPGASTLALALAGLRLEMAPLLVETDPHGGDLAARAGLTLEPGLLTLAAAGRHSINGVMLHAHTQALPNGVRALPAPTDPSQLHAVLSLVAEPLRNALTARSGRTILDAGRWVPASAATPLTDAASTIVVVFRPDVAGIEQLRVRLASLPVGRTLPVALGDRPYRPTEIAAALQRPAPLVVAHDPKAAADVAAGAPLDRWLRRSAYVRSVLALEAQLPEPAAREVRA